METKNYVVILLTETKFWNQEEPNIPHKSISHNENFEVRYNKPNNMKPWYVFVSYLRRGRAVERCDRCDVMCTVWRSLRPLRLILASRLEQVGSVALRSVCSSHYYLSKRDSSSKLDNIACSNLIGSHS